MDEVAIFRPIKRRKFTRREYNQEDHSEQTSSQLDENPKDDSNIDVTNLIRARNQNRSRATGIQFSNVKSLAIEDDTESKSLDKAPESTERYKDISSRFVGTTGVVANIDQHMMSYIDSQMAKRRNHSSNNSEHSTKDIESSIESKHLTPSATDNIHNRGSLTQIAEIDLGKSAHELNQVRTSAAIARAQSGLSTDLEFQKPIKPRRPRLGRDGKPMKPRIRPQRNSEDIARDALVEQVLHEHKLDLYTGEDEVEDRKPKDEEDDERFAEEFRREFLDQLADRKQRQKAISQPKMPGPIGNDRGPKLGGSRSARAKMAQVQKQQTQGQNSTQQR